MTTHLLDADWLIDFINGNAAVREQVLAWAERGELSTSVVVLGEVHEGLIGDSRKDAKLADLKAVLLGTEVINVSEELISWFASIRSSLRSRGVIIGDHDIWIAATALQFDLTLVSRDRHFERISGLKRFSTRT